MKMVGKNLMIILILGLELSSCKTNPVMYQQITSGNTNCETKDIQILDATAELNSTETWTAKCEGKTYLCSYHSSAGSDCHELPE